MGLDKEPTYIKKLYWSKSEIYSSLLAKAMSRNRFEAILSSIHLSDNETAQPDDRLAKLISLIDTLISKFRDAINPPEEICIDESMIPFRGRLKFRQNVPNKRYRYGIKLLKLCVKGDYTWNVKVYSGKENIKLASISTVVELVRPLLGEGRTICTDNYYNSVQFAHEINANQTHLICTLRYKKKLNSKKV